MSIDRYCGEKFEDYGIEKEGLIDKDNFIKDFVPAFMIENRTKNISAMREGLILDGEFPIDIILGCQPLQAINQQFFSNDTCSVEDIIELLQPKYDFAADEILKQNHKHFMEKAMPGALRNLTGKKSSFLLDFVLFLSGSRCIPYTQGMPDFKINILFSLDKGAEDLPSSSTCENLIHVPWSVYDNDAEVLAKKLEKAVEFGKDGFDMN